MTSRVKISARSSSLVLAPHLANYSAKSVICLSLEIIAWLLKVVRARFPNSKHTIKAVHFHITTIGSSYKYFYSLEFCAWIIQFLQTLIVFSLCCDRVFYFLICTVFLICIVWCSCTLYICNTCAANIEKWPQNQTVKVDYKRR